jgi:hypothetical protein
MELSYTKTADEVLDFFRVREEVGLSGEEVVKLRKKYGHNGEHCTQGEGRTGRANRGLVIVGAYMTSHNPLDIDNSAHFPALARLYVRQ